MKKTIFEVATAIYTIAVIYPLYWVMVALYLVLRATGCIKIKHLERIPHVGEQRILVCNHPGMLDPFLVLGILWRSCLLHPLRGPLLVVDRKNFYDSWYWFIFRPFFIPVDRDSKADQSVLRIKRALDQRRFIIYFYEGGRTHKGREFSGTVSGKRLRKPKNAIGLLALRTHAIIQPLWIEGSDKAMPNEPGRLFNVWRLATSIVRWRMDVTLKVGPAFIIPPFIETKEDATAIVVQQHLNVADE